MNQNLATPDDPIKIHNPKGMGHAIIQLQLQWYEWMFWAREYCLNQFHASNVCCIKPHVWPWLALYVWRAFLSRHQRLVRWFPSTSHNLQYPRASACHYFSPSHKTHQRSTGKFLHPPLFPAPFAFISVSLHFPFPLRSFPLPSSLSLSHGLSWRRSRTSEISGTWICNPMSFLCCALFFFPMKRSMENKVQSNRFVVL